MSFLSYMFLSLDLWPLSAAFKCSSAPFNPTVSYAEDFKRVVEFLMRHLISDSFHCAKYEVIFRPRSTVLLETKKLIKKYF